MPERFEICIVYKRRYMNTLTFLFFLYFTRLLYLPTVDFVDKT